MIDLQPFPQNTSLVCTFSNVKLNSKPEYFKITRDPKITPISNLRTRWNHAHGSEGGKECFVYQHQLYLPVDIAVQQPSWFVYDVQPIQQQFYSNVADQPPTHQQLLACKDSSLRTILGQQPVWQLMGTRSAPQLSSKNIWTPIAERVDMDTRKELNRIEAKENSKILRLVKWKYCHQVEKWEGIAYRVTQKSKRTFKQQ